MVSDSVAWLQDLDRFEMIGHTEFRDTTVTLTADRAVYFLGVERLEAYGNVRLVNLQNGTVLTGPNLTYWRRVPALRDTTELYATNRPTVEYRPPEDSVEAEPYFIVGDAIRLVGEIHAWSGGNVRIDRSNFHTQSDSAELNLATNVGNLIGHAVIEGGGAGDSIGYRLRGREVAFTSVDHQLNWVQARDSAEAVTSEFTITADTVEFSITDGLIQGGLAWGDASKSQAISETNTITADSIAIDSPNQQLRELRSFGSAKASGIADSADGEMDWIAGDTLVAFFEESGFNRRYLERLVATGRAMAFYRVYPPDGGDEPDINYSRGDRITAMFAVDGLRRVDVVGNADGVHLESARRRRRP
jgi:lipopolysaccharide export system protein LptA